MEKNLEASLLNTKIVGIGTGRTVEKIIKHLPKALTYVPSSLRTLSQLSKTGLKTTQLSICSSLDVYIDGADYFDDLGNLIKGKGGAFVHEKIMCASAKKVLIIVQEHKYRLSFTSCHVPLAVIPSAWSYVTSILKARNIKYTVRSCISGGPAFSEDGFVIIDIAYDKDFISEVCNIPGVVEHGFFGCDEFNIEINKLEVLDKI